MENKEILKLKNFYDEGKELLDLELISGESYLDCVIQEASMNRPGLALAGFQQHFPHLRLQVLGLAEYAYLNSLAPQERQVRLQHFFKHNVPCLILARGREVMDELLQLADENKVPILRTPMITWEFIHLATILIDKLTAPEMKVQGTMVDIMGIGVLLEGQPAVGKSDTALSLIRAGYSLVSDDITLLRCASWGAVIGKAVEVTQFHMEVRGIGIIHVPSLYGIASVRAEKQLDLIINLYHLRENEQNYSEDSTQRTIFGITIPQINIPVLPGRNTAQIVELAALNQRLKYLGHDAAKELDEKIIASLNRRRGSID